MIKQFVPEEKLIELDNLLSEQEGYPLSFFDEKTVAFLQDLSAELIRPSAFQRNPEIVSLSFWLRKANLLELKKQNAHLYSAPGVYPSPLGHVFHVCPANVDTMFVYSICISLLAGNKNIIRISSSINPETEHLLQSFRKILSRKEYGLLYPYICIINYPHDNKISERISAAVDARVIWGGDNTVETFKQMRTRPRCKDIVFPNRISYALINMDAFDAFNEKQRETWLNNFYNDAYVFNQKGCSSPQLLFLLNSDDKKERKFYESLSLQAEKKYKEDMLSLAPLKYNTLIGDIISDKAVEALVENNYLYLVELPQNGALPENCGGGYFYFKRIGQLNEMLPFIKSASQTLTYLGLSGQQLQELNNLLRGRGIDRIVETGNALKFNNYWDGYNLLDELTRKRYIELK